MREDKRCVWGLSVQGSEEATDSCREVVCKTLGTGDMGIKGFSQPRAGEGLAEEAGSLSFPGWSL